ncbi:lipoate--protein ligase family protein [Arthrobacter sp. JZ12]|uniref:lipoate--protein ligase family protein n=1 Tax=Arthrobacter sp. JZ12 TaxID=2654190 RepID=UPI002B47F908|nr:lipoate--protein ligase family protein [Arthrobacter sp. JZ12]WRH24827.1 lipoate--protein ligase family protein [Arthrobacter sp. JZ12]
MSTQAWSNGPLALVRDPSRGAAADLERGLELLRAAAAGELPPTLRLYRPSPTVAFGQRDARLPGFHAASEAARRHGFEPLIRKAGGRAAAYHPGCLIVDHIESHEDAIAGSRVRFGLLGEILAAALRKVGVDAAVGEIPGEYCPGEFSVHGNGAVQIKLVGTAQRVISGAWLFSSVVVVENSEPIRAVLEDTYAALGLSWDPATAGAADDLLPGLTVDEVSDAVVAVYDEAAR